MSSFDLVLVICAGVLAAAALGVVYRMIVGPTILDRALASDSLVTLVVMGMALYAAQTRAAWAGPAMLGLTGLAFIGTVTFARFVAREDSLSARELSAREGAERGEPATETAAHEAIHLGPRTVPGEEPQNLAPSGTGSGVGDTGAVGSTAASEDEEDLGDGAGLRETGGFGGTDSFGTTGGFGSTDGFGSSDGFGEEGRSRWPEEPGGEGR